METYHFGALVGSGIAGLIFGALLVYFIMRERVEWTSDAPMDDPKRMNFTSIDALPAEFPSSGPHVPDYVCDPEKARERDEQVERLNEEQRIEDEREKVTLEKHIKSLMRAGYVMVDGIPRRYLFCLEEGEKTPFGNMYYRNEEPEECLSIEIRDQRRITQPPEWYDLISDCYKLVDGVKSLRYALMLSMGVEQDTIERPLRLVFYDNGYMPVIKVYTDMSWFDDQRWGGPVIIVGHNGQAMGIVPAMKPYDVHLLMEEVVAKALPFMDAMPSDYDGHMQLSQGIAELHAAIKEAGCHAKEVEEA
jgi:hypothetical protein